MTTDTTKKTTETRSQKFSAPAKARLRATVVAICAGGVACAALPVGAVDLSGSTSVSGSHSVNPHEDEAFHQFMKDCLWGASGDIAFTESFQEQKDAKTSAAWGGMITFADSISNSGTLSARADRNVSVTAKGSMNFHVGIFEGKDALGKDVVMDHWNICNETSPKMELVPGLNYTYRQDLIVNLIGMSVNGGIAENHGRIELAADVRTDLKSHASFEFSTEQRKPTEEEVKDHAAQTHVPLEWTIKPAMRVLAEAYLDVNLTGMTGRAGTILPAAIVNTGSITIDGRLSRTDTVTIDKNLNDFEDFKESIMSNNNEHYIAVKVDCSEVKAETLVEGNFRISGMHGVSGSERKPPTDEPLDSSEDESDSPEEGFRPAPVVIVNTGTITLSGSEEFTTAGVFAEAKEQGSVLVENRGRIDVSEAEGPVSHQFYGSITGSGHIVMGDWVLMTDDLREDAVTPLALRRESEASGTLSFLPGATLMLIPSKPQDLDGPVKLGPVFGTYDEKGDFEKSSLEGIEGSFSAIATGSTMLAVSTEGNLNNLAATFTVRPEDALGRDMRRMGLTSHLGALLSVLSMTDARGMDDGAAVGIGVDDGQSAVDGRLGVTILPWYENLQVDATGGHGFDAKGGGVILEAHTRWGAADDWRASAHVGVAHRKLNADNGRADASATHTTVGAEISKALGDVVALGARVEVERETADWTVRDILGVGEASPDVTSLYADIHADAAWQLTPEQKADVRVAVGWLKVKQDAFELTTLGTGRVDYDAGEVETPVLSVDAGWRMTTEVAGYTVEPHVRVGVTYLTDADYSTDFAYLAHRYQLTDEVDDLYGTLAAGLAFGRGNWTLGLSGVGRVSGDTTAYGLNARATWRW